MEYGVVYMFDCYVTELNCFELTELHVCSYLQYYLASGVVGCSNLSFFK